MHQDVDLEVSTADELALYLLTFLRPQQQVVVKRFLTDLLRRNPDGNLLQHVWNGTNPDWDFGDDEELRTFLTMIRDAIK
jgi:hypothetical protein